MCRALMSQLLGRLVRLFERLASGARKDHNVSGPVLKLMERDKRSSVVGGRRGVLLCRRYRGLAVCEVGRHRPRGNEHVLNWPYA